MKEITKILKEGKGLEKWTKYFTDIKKLNINTYLTRKVTEKKGKPNTKFPIWPPNFADTISKHWRMPSLNFSPEERSLWNAHGSELYGKWMETFTGSVFQWS